jgi:predicted N-formylglutamate amidohydrolase
VIVTIHSFTPVYHGQHRAVEIGVLHDSDARLADAMLDIAGRHTPLNVLRNAPYGPQDGVTHTLKEHAIRSGHLNVMIEIRSDLIETQRQQTDMAAMLAGWIAAAVTTAQGGVNG